VRLPLTSYDFGAGKLKSLFGSSSNATLEEDLTSETTQAEKEAQKPLTAPADEKAEPITSESTTTTTTSSAKPTPTLSAKERSAIKLKIESSFIGIRPLTKQEKLKSRNRWVHSKILQISIDNFYI
jgi:hypothetical protein